MSRLKLAVVLAHVGVGMKNTNRAATVRERPATDPLPDSNAKWLAHLDHAATSEEELSCLQAPPREPIVGEWFKAGDLGFIFGPRGLGKTWFALLLARKCAEGVRMADWTVHQPRRVLYVDGEMPLEGLRERNEALATAPAPRLTFIQHEALFERTGQVLNLTNPAIRSALLEKCRRDKTEILFLDNLSCLVGNEAQAWEQVTPWLLELRRNRIAVVIVAQAGRNGLMRGSSRREDAAFWIIQLMERHRADEAEGASFLARFVKNRNATAGDCPTLEWHFFKPRNEVKAQVTWNKLQREDQFRQCIEDGLTSATEIAREMNVTKGYVSRLATRAMNEGWLTKKGREYAKKRHFKFSCADLFGPGRAATVRERPEPNFGKAMADRGNNGTAANSGLRAHDDSSMASVGKGDAIPEAVDAPSRSRLCCGGPGELITPEIACRISERLALGLPVPLALAAEENPHLTEERWDTALQQHPRLASAVEASKARFCDYALRQLFDSDGKNLRWFCRMLERTYPELFGRRKTKDAPEIAPPSDDRTDKPTRVVGLSDEYVRLLQEAALKL